MNNIFNNIKLYDKQSLVEYPIVDQMYALYDQEIWYRVVIECVNEDSTFKCFFVDIGKSIDSVNKNEIHKLPSELLKIFGQVIKYIMKYNTI